MNSNHSTLCSKYEGNRMECKTGKKQSQRKRSTDCNINETWISDNSFTFNFVLQKYMFSKASQQQDKFQPPSHKIDANI